MKKTRIILSSILALVIISVSFIFLNQRTAIRNLLLVLSLIIFVVPFVGYYAKRLKEQKEKDHKFLEFVRDIVESVRAGTPIARAILNLKDRNYGELKIHVEKLANQISLGIPLTTAFETFAGEAKSPVISRSISLISEANRSGGEINTILSSVASSVNQTETIKKERRASTFNLIVQGYIIFFVFILIILALEFFLIPLVQDLGPIEDLNVEIRTGSDIDFSHSLFFLLIVQSFFSGLVIGKISEGKLIAGIKHSFILVSLALLFTTVSRLFFS